MKLVNNMNRVEMYSVEQQLAEECVNIFTNASDEPTTTGGSGWHEIIVVIVISYRELHHRKFKTNRF